MYIANSVFFVVGIAASGLSATKRLLERGAKCYIYDESTASHIVKNKEDLLRMGAIDAGNNASEAIAKADVVVVSPGIPVDHEIPVSAKRQKKRVIGELELGFLLSSCPIVAITGTNGKTTTASLIHSILCEAKLKSYLVGNVGTPICEYANELDENTVAVTEVSSFQLETVHMFCPHIALILNITPDHLERHYNMQNYIFLKRKILANMRESEFAVLNQDDAVVAEFAKVTRSKIVYFSTKSEVDGAYVSGGSIFFKGERVLSLSDVPLEGAHNLENVLAAICATRLMDVESRIIENAIKRFKGVKHRIELITEAGGIKFVNDSKATNIDATIKAVDSLKAPTVIILGGKDKGLDYISLFERLKNSEVLHAVLIGETRFKMAESAKKVGFSELTLTDSFENSIIIAKNICPDGGVVLLSPATSSFDMFSSFEERGREFARIVGELTSENELEEEENLQDQAEEADNADNLGVGGLWSGKNFNDIE